MQHLRNLDKIIIILALLAGCTITNIRVRNENGSSSTIDTSTSANPVVDPNVNIPGKQ